MGHEVAHVLEGTALYTELQNAVFKYAKTKGEYDSRLKAITELYKKHDPKADPKKELTADLIGDYLFTDSDFVNNLVAGNRSLSQKIYNEIRYFLKIVTAGSKEARQLEQVKKAFAKAYRENIQGTADTTNDSVMYSYSRPNFTKEEWAIVNRRKHSEFYNPKFDLDNDQKWMYVNEKGSPVFAVYSKHDADDPTVLYGSSGKAATKDYEKVAAHLNGGRNAKQGRGTLDRLLADIQRNEGYWRNGFVNSEGTQSATEDVSIPFGEPGSNGRGNQGDGKQYRQELTKYNEEASDNSDASSVTWSNDYVAIRNFMKEGDGNDKTSISNGDKPQFSLSDSDGNQLTPEQQAYFKDSKVRLLHLTYFQ